MGKHLTPEEERELERLDADYQRANKAMDEAKMQFGPDSTQFGAALEPAAKIWKRICELRPPTPEIFGLPKGLWK